MRKDIRSDIARDILGYLVEHADAEDTLEGVTEWWLLQQTIRRTRADVADALAELVARGLLIERSRPGARPHYRINKRRRSDIVRLVKADGARSRGSS